MGLKAFRRIEDIEVWKRGCRLAIAIFKLVENDKLSKNWVLRDQICRAALSIPSNIAEGYERDSQAEFRRFLLIAKGSCGELRTQLYIIKAIKFADENEIDKLLQECTEISSMLKSLSTQLGLKKTQP
ncbi:MAG: four helix bundle protein [Calditrichota bacterium]